MKISEQWLREWVNPAVSTDELAARLTMAGLEVESIEPAGAAVHGVVAAEVREVSPHPDATKLRVCRVFDGETESQVVCGAANVRAGLRVPFARVGAVLPGITIARASLRGVESEGMLCSADELGLQEQRSEGLLELPSETPLGTDIGALFGRDDRVIGLKLTPNRGDCLGMRGLARETAALYGIDSRSPDLSAVPAVIDDRLDVRLEAPDYCPRYCGRVVRDVDLSVPSPPWLQERLRRAGLRSIDAVVDITNLVMLELGQPLHAFDLAQLDGGIVVRRARDAEKLPLLDGSEVTLRADTLVIADHSRAVAAAGIMGGAGSAVSLSTRDVFLEAAFFAPQPMAGKARAYGMQTDASQRFERGVDFELQATAIERATRLLLEVAGGKPGPVVTVVSPSHLPVLQPIRLRASRLDMLLGIRVPHDDVEAILARLGLPAKACEGGWEVSPTSYRFDIRLEADLAEEVGRVWGYERIPVRVQPAAVPMRRRQESLRQVHDLRERLCTLGYQEVITYSFVPPDIQALLAPGVVPVAVQNPISSDMSVMRTSLWAGLLGALRHNQNRQQRRVRLFETGLRFLPGADGLRQEMGVAGLISGARYPEGWAGETAPVDFFDIKGDVESLLDTGDGRLAGWNFHPGEHPALHPGQTSQIVRDGVCGGLLGALHPRLLAALDLTGPVYLFEFDIEAIRRKTLPSFKGLSRFPEVRRDIAVVVDDDLPAGVLLGVAADAAGACLKDLKLFDVYRGQGIDLKKKSMAISVVLQAQDRTLTEAEVGAVVEGIVAALVARCGAVPRY
jgi:phenylalanyl-tRNA synthetase beta chain